jgi:signal transduction histidine kinase
MRVCLDVAVAKPGPVPEETITLAGRLREELDQVDRILEGFLALARAQRGPNEDATSLSLSKLASTAIDEHAGAIADKHLDIDEQADPAAVVIGSETLLLRMVSNIIDNAVKYNEQGGWIRVRTQADGEIARLVVENSGRRLEEDTVQVLLQPFRRLGADRTGSENGNGLGLSIVDAVADAHGGKLALHALDDGGLQVVVDLPLALGALAGATAWGN